MKLRPVLGLFVLTTIAACAAPSESSSAGEAAMSQPAAPAANDYERINGKLLVLNQDIAVAAREIDVKEGSLYIVPDDIAMEADRMMSKGDSYRISARALGKDQSGRLGYVAPGIALTFVNENVKAGPSAVSGETAGFTIAMPTVTEAGSRDPSEVTYDELVRALSPAFSVK